MPTNLEQLVALQDKVDTPERLAMFQAYGAEQYADAEFLNIIKGAILEIQDMLGNVVVDIPSWQQTLEAGGESTENPVIKNGEISKVTLTGKGPIYNKGAYEVKTEYQAPTASVIYTVPAKPSNDTYAMASDLAPKLNKAANVEYESLPDTSEIHGFMFFTRVGAIFRSANMVWNESLKKLTVKGTQAIWEAYQDVTDGNMGIKILAGAVEAFKFFDNVGNFMSFGTESGKRLARIFTAIRQMNGPTYNETEFKYQQCLGSVTTLLKSISVPSNSILTIDVLNISVMNIDKDYIIGHCQFSFKNNAGTVTNISRDELRYGRQYSSLASAYVSNSDTRIEANFTGTTAALNFVNTVNKATNVQCEIKITTTLIPEA